MKELGRIKPDVKRPPFAHGAEFSWDPAQPALLMSYHPSRQNTQTGRLTKEMFHSVFAPAKAMGRTAALRAEADRTIDPKGLTICASQCSAPDSSDA